MSRRLLATIASVTSLAFAAPALADPVRIVSNGSGIAAVIYAAEGVDEDLVRYPDTPDGNNSFDLTALVGGSSANGSASIANDLTDLLHMRSTGSTSASYETTIGEGSSNVLSSFFVFFEIDRPLGFVFDSDFTTSGDALSVREREHWSQWNVSLFEMGPGGMTREVLAGAGTESAAFLRDGLLLPGVYRFQVFTTSFAGNFVRGPAAGSVFSNFAFSLDLNELDGEPPAPTPEPASLLLMGTGLGGLIAARRRQRRAGRASRVP